MANERVIPVDLGGRQIDSSGVGKLLFQHFEEARKNKAAAAQLDVTEGIREKYRAQAAAQGNVFEQGMARLRHALSQESTDLAYQRQQEAQQQAATHLEGMVRGAAERGVPMPGMTKTEIGTPEAGGMPGPAITPTKIAPGAVPLASRQFERNLEESLKQQGEERGLGLEVRRKQLLEQMDVTDDATAVEARDWHNRFKALGADPRLLAQIEGYTTPGQGRKSDWQTVKTKIIPEEMKLTAQATTKMALAKEITARQQNIAALKASAARLLANTRMDATQFKNLASLHTELGREVTGLMKRHSETMEAYYAESDPKRQAQTLADAQRIRVMADDVQTQQAAIAERMASWQPLNPGSPTPGQAGPTAPGGLQALPKPGDPLGILR